MFLFYVLSFFKKGNTIQGGTLLKEIRYLFRFSIKPYLCVCCFAWDANVGCICLSWTCWGCGGWGWRWDCWWGWGTCWGCGTCCRTCCGCCCCCCCCGCWGRCSTTTSRWISASDVLRSEIKSLCKVENLENFVKTKTSDVLGSELKNNNKNKNENHQIINSHFVFN